MNDKKVQQEDEMKKEIERIGNDLTNLILKAIKLGVDEEVIIDLTEALEPLTPYYVVMTEEGRIMNKMIDDLVFSEYFKKRRNVSIKNQKKKRTKQ